MPDTEIEGTMKALRAALIGDPDLTLEIGDRVVDEPREEIQFPYVRFGVVTPRSDDTDHHIGSIVQVGLVIHSRPNAGRIEAAMICGMIKARLHRRPDLLSYDAFTVCDMLVQTWAVDRGADGASYEGRVALEIHLDT